MNEPREPRRRRGLIVAFVLVLVVLGALIGAVSSAVRGATYTSEAQLSWNPSVRAALDPNYTTPDSTTFDREVADQQDVVLSDEVVAAVAQKESMTRDEVRDAVTVTTTAGSSVFEIAASASTPAEARRIATDVTDEYVASLLAANTATLQQRVDALTPVIAALRRQLTGATAAAAGPLAANIADLQSQSAAYTVALADVPVEATVLREPAAPTAPSSLGIGVSLLIGAALGLIVAVCIVLLANSIPGRPQVGFLTRPARPTGARPAPAPAPASVVTMPSVAAAPAAAAPAAAAPVAPAASTPAEPVAEPADEVEPAEPEAPQESDEEQPRDADGDGDGKGRGRLTPAPPPYFG